MNSFDVENFYAITKSGEYPDPGELFRYVRAFDNVVLWGASYLGQAIGSRLLKEGIRVATYWDLRSRQLGQVNGLPVVQPFAGNLDRSSTLIILCISNNLLKPGLLQALEKEGFPHLAGDSLFMGLCCPSNLRNGVSPETCMRSMCCRFIFCERLGNIVKHQCQTKHAWADANPLFISSITVVVNSMCSLSCKYCTSYMHTYPKADRKNIPLSRICEDLDRFFAAVDGVGAVTVMGGEPFLHPDLSGVVQTLLGKPNCGLISISTSGTAPIRTGQIEGLKDQRVNVSYSNYLGALQPSQQQCFHENIEVLQREGIPYTIGTEMPQWIIPSTLYDLGLPAKRLAEKKRHCPTPPRCIQLKNGKIHPCDLGNAVHSLRVADYPSDYVDLAKPSPISDLREQIRTFMDASYYRVCGHCDYSGGMTSMAGEQGFHDFLTSAGTTVYPSCPPLSYKEHA